MANLLVEIGNTAVKAALSEEMTLGKTFRYQGVNTMDFILSLLEREHPDMLVLASTYEISDVDVEKIEKLCHSSLILDSAHRQLLTSFGLPVFLSFDRAASILAVRYLFKGRGCTLMDFGTTLTVDFTDENGHYLGGNISLGWRTRLKALNRYSRTLPLIDNPSLEPEEIGFSLIGAMESGVISGIMFEMEGYMNLHPDNVIVFTGGDSNYFAQRLKKSVFVIPNLVQMGLALIADENVKKSNN